MIEGLTVTIDGLELISLCREHAQKRSRQAVSLRAQRDSMIHAGVEATTAENLSNSIMGDPKQAVLNKALACEQEAEELVFLAAHFKANETYQLSRSDLQRIGVVRSNY